MSRRGTTKRIFPEFDSEPSFASRNDGGWHYFIRAECREGRQDETQVGAWAWCSNGRFVPWIDRDRAKKFDLERSALDKISSGEIRNDWMCQFGGADDIAN